MSKKAFASIDDLKAFVGQDPVFGAPITIDQSMIDAFAGVTGDHQWIHVDEARAAKESPYGSTIAHGLLSLSLITSWYNELFEYPGREMSLNYGFDKIRFIKPVPVNTKMVGGYQIARVEDVKDGVCRVYWKVSVGEPGADKPAIVGDWIMQMSY